MTLDIFPQRKRKRTLTAADKKRIAANQGWRCKRCGKPLPARYHIDHIKELSGGGSDRESNLQALCPNCHADKTEEDRHRKRQNKIREKERQKSEGLFGSGDLFGHPPKRQKSRPLLDIGFGSPKKKGKKKKPKNIWEIYS